VLEDKTQLIVTRVRLGHMPVKRRHDDVPKITKGDKDTDVAVRHNAMQELRRQGM
jgi:hypothetical protein